MQVDRIKMSPKPKFEFVQSEYISTVTTMTTTISSSKEEVQAGEDEIKRDEIFLRTDRPFYLDQHIFHIVWHGTAHLLAGYYFYLIFTMQVPMTVILIEFAYGYFGGLGITVGCHRYWTHKSFKAKLPLQILLMIMQTIANQHPIHKWCLEHRIHHKYTDTDADPHNSKRGFWFSHMGWLFVPKEKILKKKLKTFDMSDLERDPVVRFQSRWFYTLLLIFHYIIPISAIYYLWEIPLLHCVVANYGRYVVSLHFTWCVNSVAHIWGDRPYDKNITAVDNPVVSFLTVGEGWHNYHHTFPWDYRASEFGWKINASTMFIDFFAAIGWAYDLKTVSQKMLKDRLQRTGDGSRVGTAISTPELLTENSSSNQCDFEYKIPSASDVTELMKSVDNNPSWGWDDDNIPDDLRKVTKILRPERTI